MRIAIFALLLASCAPALVRGAERPPRAAHAAVLDVVIEEWRATTGLGWTDACDEERERIAIALVDDDAMRSQVGYCASSGPTCAETWDPADREGTRLERARRGCLLGTCVAGSATWQHSEPWPIGLGAPWQVTLLISRYLDEPAQRAGIVHEAGHWLSHCTTRFADEAHREPLVWGAGGVVERASARVR